MKEKKNRNDFKPIKVEHELKSADDQDLLNNFSFCYSTEEKYSFTNREADYPGVFIIILHRVFSHKNYYINTKKPLTEERFLEF